MGAIKMQLLAQFLEQKALKRLNFKECLLINDQKAKIVANKIWYLMAEQPVVSLDRQVSYWGKRLYSAVFLGSRLPVALEFEQSERGILPPKIVELDEAWHTCEEQLQLESEQAELNKAQTQRDIDTGLVADASMPLPAGMINLFGESDYPDF